MSKYSREKIKLRMLKRVAMLLDISDIESVDPILRLFTEAMAEEIFNLSGEISDMDDRLLSKLSASMTPVTHLTARPAHAILSAMPIDAMVSIDKDTLFEYKEARLLRKYNLNNIFFTPIVPFDLSKANIRFITTGAKLYQYDEARHKYIIATAEIQDEHMNNSMWIGVDVSSEIISLNDFSFYFDFMNIEDKSKYLQALAYTQWTLCGKILSVKQGLKKTQEDTPEGDNYTKSQIDTVRSELQSIYDIHYITVNEISTGIKQCFPDEWADYYSPEVLSRFTTPLLWIKILFPDSIPDEILDTLRIGINLFPVANMSKRTITQRMSDVSVFMPLETGKNEYFMEVESVRDSSGKIYEPLSTDASPTDNQAKGTYSIRRGGVEQYSHTNDTQSTLLRFVDIVRDRNLFSDSKAEAEFDRMINDILVLTDKISKAAKSLKEERDVKSYILVDKSSQGEILTADYLVTNGSTINNFKPITMLSATKYSSALEDKIYFLTPVQGGTPTPSGDKINDIHRYMLTSHDRIFTRHDVLNFCRAEYGQFATRIEIKPGVAIGTAPGEGLIKTIDIHLIMEMAQLPDLSEEKIKTELLSKLNRRSPESFSYQIFINK